MAVAAVTEDHRRSKTALFLLACGWAGAAPHWVDAGRNLIPAITLAFVLGGYGLQAVLSSKWRVGSHLLEEKQQSFIDDSLPKVDILVAARDEESVVKRLVRRIFSLNYPEEKLSIWIIDDGSQDATPKLLEALQDQFSRLNVIRRSRGEGGGKSGALNSAFKKGTGDWLFILDADAQFQEDLLKRLVLFAEEGGWSAVQLRKSVVNANYNFLTKAQAMEMAMDAVLQQGRLGLGGVAELRGNGQLLKRSVLEQCDGFNELTVTDDLDLSFRILAVGESIGILWDPPIQEEGVETLPALWRQRQRWAEGGLQRFFDYWPVLISNKLSFSMRRDIAFFFLLQYVLPLVSFFDLLISLFSRSAPTYWPLSFVAFSVSGLAYWRGCNAQSEGPDLPQPNFGNLIMAIVYLSHWFIVIPWVIIRMAILPKRLKWVKTNHRGN